MLTIPPRGRGRTSTGGSDNALGENGLLRSVIQGKVSVSGLERLTLLKKQLELMISRLAGSGARKLR